MELVDIDGVALAAVRCDIFETIRTVLGGDRSDHEIEDVIAKGQLTDDQCSDLFNVTQLALALHHTGPSQFGIADVAYKKLAQPVLWTYPQVRIDLPSRNKFDAPWHRDRWISFKSDVGVIIWYPVTTNGGNLEVFDVEPDVSLKRDEYWGIMAETDEKGHKIHVEYGQALIFDSQLLHRSVNDDYGKVTCQLRYDDLKEWKDYQRPVTQKITDYVIDSQKELLGE